MWSDPRIPHRTEYDFVFRMGAEDVRSKHTETQMIAAVKQMEASRKAENVAHEVGSARTQSMPEVAVRWHGCEPGAGSQASAG